MLEQLRLKEFALDSCSNAVLWISREGSLPYVNDAAARQLGYTRHELLSMTAHDLAPAFPPDAWQEIWRRIELDRSLTLETKLRHKDGTLISVEVRTDLMDVEGDEFLFALVTDITKRKEGEENQRRIESIQRSIMENSLDTIMLLDPCEKILFINRTEPGLTRDQVIDTPITQHVAEEFHPRMRACYRRVLETGQPSGYQVDYTRTDGRVSTWEARVTPVWTDDRVTGMTVVTRDITDSRQAEQALRESERSFARAQQLAQMGSWEYDLATGQATGSTELHRMMGLSENEPLPTMESFVSEFVHPDDRELIARAFQRALTNNVSEAVGFRFLPMPDRDVRFVHAEAEIISGHDGAPRKIIGTFQDVTEQKKVELALRESEEKFRVLTERSPAIVFIARSDRIIYCNAMLAQVTGYSNDELLRTDFMDFIHPDYRDLVANRHRQRLNGEEPPQRYEMKIVAKGGECRWLDLSAQLIEFQGHPAVLVCCVDITERKRTEAQLRAMEGQLAHVSRLSTMGEMVAGIAHEINQPLSAIANFALACQNTVRTLECEFKAPIEDWLQEVNEQAVRCGDIIRRLRNFVKKSDGEREWVDLNRVVRDSVALIGSDLDRSPRVIDCRLPNPGPRIHVNQIQLQQVLVNLLRNACDATHENITPSINVHVGLQNGYARLTVEDNGCGVEEFQRERLFDPFFTTKPEGMGMGLAISKSIVEAHGGRLRFDPGVSSGAIFHVELPAADESEQNVG